MHVLCVFNAHFFSILAASIADLNRHLVGQLLCHMRTIRLIDVVSTHCIRVLTAFILFFTHSYPDHSRIIPGDLGEDLMLLQHTSAVQLLQQLGPNSIQSAFLCFLYCGIVPSSIVASCRLALIHPDLGNDNALLGDLSMGKNGSSST